MKLTIIGQRVRHAREQLGLRQQDIATAAGITRSQVANLEAGRTDRGVGALCRIAEALHLDPGHLLRPASCEQCGARNPERVKQPNHQHVPASAAGSKDQP